MDGQEFQVNVSPPGFEVNVTPPDDEAPPSNVYDNPPYAEHEHGAEPDTNPGLNRAIQAEPNPAGEIGFIDVNPDRPDRPESFGEAIRRDEVRRLHENVVDPTQQPSTNTGTTVRPEETERIRRDIESYARVMDNQMPSSYEDYNDARIAQGLIAEDYNNARRLIDTARSSSFYYPH